MSLKTTLLTSRMDEGEGLGLGLKLEIWVVGYELEMDFVILIFFGGFDDLGNGGLCPCFGGFLEKWS